VCDACGRTGHFSHRAAEHQIFHLAIIAALPRERLRPDHERMTKEKFDVLCRQVLIPRLGDLMHAQLTDILQTLDVMSHELVRIGDGLERIVSGQNAKR